PALTSTTTYWVRVSNPLGAADSAGAIVSTPPTILTSSTLPSATATMPYSATVAASNSIPPYAWTLTPGFTLPPGLAFDGSTGTLTGRPPGVGTFQFGLTVRGADLQVASRVFSLTVITTPDALLAQQWYLVQGTVEAAGTNALQAWAVSRGAGVT